jgi:hypothetical protein
MIEKLTLHRSRDSISSLSLKRYTVQKCRVQEELCAAVAAQPIISCAPLVGVIGTDDGDRAFNRHAGSVDGISQSSARPT